MYFPYQQLASLMTLTDRN